MGIGHCSSLRPRRCRRRSPTRRRPRAAPRREDGWVLEQDHGVGDLAGQSALREPVHRRGVTQFPGIYFLGLRWLYKRKSAFLLRASGAEDAAYLAEQIMAGAKDSQERPRG